MLGKIASAGQNGQFRTPRHIIQLMVEMTAPTPTDEICDPACGTAGFLVAAGEYLRARAPEPPARREAARALPRRPVPRLRLRHHDAPHRQHEHAAARRREPGHPLPRLARRGARGDAEAYTLVLANPPFAGSLDYESVAKDLQAIVKTKKTELLFLALFLRLLKPGGRAAVIVPDGVLFGSSNAHKALRRILVEDQKLDAVVKLPERRLPAVRRCLDRDPALHEDQLRRHRPRLVLRRRRPTAGASTTSGRRYCPADSLGPTPGGTWLDLDHARNNLPDVLVRWHQRASTERERPRTAQSFCVPVAEIAAQGFDLSLNRYREVAPDDTSHRSPKDLIAELADLEARIERELSGLAETLG